VLARLPNKHTTFGLTIASDRTPFIVDAVEKSE
jgi:hypothetical protein